ncbi:MAG: AsnC family transcriptional regulator [Micavibrio sp.]|nr:AsnC family transcriptional regulator [Micavibrio sp.]|tara:strand:+ start:2255 stop:2749 length:495 start_codon:yes stop_codon:yes gene_type:complete
MKLDKIDLKILETLQRHGRITNQELAQHISLSPSACMERHKKLEKEGIIRSYGAEVALEKIAPYSAVLVEVTLKNHLSVDFQRFENAMIRLPEVVDCYAVGGGIDYIVKFIARNIEHYQEMMDRILDDDIGIDRYFTYFITRQIKKTAYPVSRFTQDNISGTAE